MLLTQLRVSKPETICASTFFHTYFPEINPFRLITPENFFNSNISSSFSLYVLRLLKADQQILNFCQRDSAIRRQGF